jgi:ATP-dependent Lon protease
VVVKLIPRQVETGSGIEAVMSKVIALFEQYVKLSNNLHYDAMLAAVRVEDPGKLADTISSHLVVDVAEKQNLLEIFSPQERLQRILTILEAEVDKLQVDKRIQGRVKKQMERAQKEYYLNEKMKAIQKELGRKDDRLNEVEELRKKIELARMSKDAEDKALQELKRLESMPPMSAEATVSRNYLDWLIAVPWSKKTRERKDLLAAETILNDDHYGLEKVKERIVEFLAVRQLVNKPKGPILCFVGPPGVGKTSLAKSIARCTNRKFVRMSLGGVRDEAEIRGHRRTYIGAFPGQIIQMMKKAGRATPSSSWTRWTRCPWTSGATPRPPCWRSWTPSRTTPSTTTTWTSSSTSPRSSSSPPPTCSTPSPRPCRTASRSCACRGTRSRRRWRSPSGT